jgi:hypothetical protein
MISSPNSDQSSSPWLVGPFLSCFFDDSKSQTQTAVEQKAIMDIKTVEFQPFQDQKPGT